MPLYGHRNGTSQLAEEKSGMQRALPFVKDLLVAFGT
jgi:hypothetical protein